MKKLHFFQFFRKIFQLYFQFFSAFTGIFSKNRQSLSGSPCNLQSDSDCRFSIFQKFSGQIRPFSHFSGIFPKNHLEYPSAQSDPFFMKFSGQTCLATAHSHEFFRAEILSLRIFLGMKTLDFPVFPDFPEKFLQV